ncbi:MAG: bifunctional demethylmenaquinone methyltransferase/2-methoxy-6-polyprenyl-1,4-benzoquinol methylase UbiE [Nitrospirota bacterium]
MNTVDHKERDAAEVSQMFSRIARRYDLLNHVLSLGLDIGWRRKVARATSSVRCRNILDVCTGTGDMAIELCRFWKGSAHVEGLDFSRELIDIAKGKVLKAGLQDKIILREGNAEELPYGNGQFDAITVTFGLRNINNRGKALQEFHRVTRPGGCFVCLEFSQPTNPVFEKIYSFYLTKFVPFVSLVVGSDPGAYRYLGNTIKDFPVPEELSRVIGSAGWTDVTHRHLAGGVVAIHQGRK